MKGVVFTLDGLFALLIAGVAISILAYFSFYGQAAQIIQSSTASAISSALLSAKLSSLTADPIALAMISQGSGANQTWSQIGNNASATYSNPTGPLNSSVSYIITLPANVVSGTIVADYNKIFFAAGNTIYAYGANGNFSWSRDMGTDSIDSLSTSGGKLIYLDTANITALNPYNGNIIWSNSSFNSGEVVTSPLLSYSGLELFGVSNLNRVYAYYVNNGTVAWTYNTPTASSPTPVLNMSASSGSIIMQGAGYTTDVTFPQQGGSPYRLGTAAVPNTKGLSAWGTYVGYGNGNEANVLTIAGGIVTGTTVNTINTGSAVQGAAFSNGDFFFQSSSNTLAININGIELWSNAISSTPYGTALNNAHPVVSSGLLYTLWSKGYIIAQNTSTGVIKWTAQFPYGTSNPDMALAYGRLYLSMGKKLIAVGACTGNLNSSVLAVAATEMVNNESSCAYSLLNSVNGLSNYTMLINYKSQLLVPKFNSVDSYAISSKRNIHITTPLTMVAWVNWKGGGGTQGIVALVNSTQCSGDIFGMYISGGQFGMFPGCPGPRTTSPALTYNKNQWGLFAMQINSTGETLYLNQQAIPDSVAPQSTGSAVYNVSIGDFSQATYFNGSIVNVQIYNSSLTYSQIENIYSRGAFGGPLQNAGLVAWYPLTGDSNDYSGLYNTGYPTNVVYGYMNYTPKALGNSYSVRSATVVLPLLNYSTGLYRNYNVTIESWS